MGCVAGDITFVTLAGFHERRDPRDMVLETWTLSRDLNEWVQQGKRLAVADLWASESFRERGLPQLTPAFPVLSVDDADVVYVVMNDVENEKRLNDYGELINAPGLAWPGCWLLSFSSAIDSLPTPASPIPIPIVRSLAACAEPPAHFSRRKTFLAGAVSDVPVSFPVLGKKDVLSSSSSAPQDGPAGLAGAVVCSMLAHLALLALAASQSAAPGSASVSERVATSVVRLRPRGRPPRRRLRSSRGPQVPATKPLVSPTRRRASWETISVSEAGSSVASAKAVACASNAVPAAPRLAPKPSPPASPAPRQSQPPATQAPPAPRPSPTPSPPSSSPATGAKAVTFACHTGSETVPVTGFTGSAAAFAELHAVDDLDVGPALTQLLRAVLPGRRAGCEGCGQGCDASVLIQDRRTGGACHAGRRDGLVSLASNVRRNIIDTGFSVDAMASSFTAKGLTLDDLVTLSGGERSMTPVDGSMNTDYANELIRACSANGTVAAGTAVDCDAGSASVFDNRYFANLLDGRGLLRTDAVLVQNATTRAKVAEFAQSQDGFFASWAESYARLTNLGVKTGADGEIRRTCSSVNG
ncbi:hypothetical protein HU200_006601 [Digitaria exilis]|uniref:Plant heme peroxidase family profile domain-containing protein n=1 Tax=Digitaria exilis TaxID=1010633 RepID=A0A835FR12_9POAL|nr:hypothetical protein HU200_006601 [Digitaria exilis]